MNPNINKNGEIVHNMNLNPLDIIPWENQSSTIIVKNLMQNITEEDLYRVFNKYGRVINIKLFNKSKTNPPCACIIFENNNVLEGILYSNENFSKNTNVLRFDNEKLLWLINEDINKIKRDIDKINRPEHLAKLLQKEPVDLQNHFHYLLSNHILSFMAQSIRVREIWVGNLPSTIKKEDLMNNFSVYGKIENLHHFPKPNNHQNFAFIKFNSTEAALNALNDQENLSVKFKVNLRMSFADFLKRYNIVGDDPNYETPDENFSNILIILYNHLHLIPNYKIIKDNFSQFGKVKNILYRPSINKDMKSFILIEMEKVEQVKRIRRFYNQEDLDNKKKYKLGDNKCEINILIKPSISANLHELLIPYLPKLELENKEKNILESYIMNKNLSYSLFWSGFFVKDKKQQVGTDAYLVYGNEKELLKDNLFNLNINQKIKYEDFLNNQIKKDPKGVVIFRASNETQIPKFNDLINYLKNKNEIGIINQMESHWIYLISFNNISKQYVNNCDVNDLVGVFLSTEKELDLNDVELNYIKEEIKKNPNLYNYH